MWPTNSRFSGDATLPVSVVTPSCVSTLISRAATFFAKVKAVFTFAVVAASAEVFRNPCVVFRTAAAKLTTWPAVVVHPCLSAI